MNISQIQFYAVKCLAISYFAALYFVSGISVGHFINSFYESENIEGKSKTSVLMEIMVFVSLISVSSFFIRKFIRTIPFPLNGTAGFDASILKERTNGTIIFAFSLVVTLSALKKRIDYYMDA